MKDTREKLKEVVSFIPGFKIIRSYDHGGNISNGKLDIFIRLSGGHGGKGSSSVYWPNCEDNSCMSASNWGVVKYNESDPTSCNFNPEKDSKAIARDVIRKTIEPGLPLIKIIDEKLIKRKAEKVARETGIKKLGDLIDEKPFGENRITKFYECEPRIYLEIKARHADFEVNVNGLSLKQATKLIKIIEKEGSL